MKLGLNLTLTWRNSGLVISVTIASDATDTLATLTPPSGYVFREQAVTITIPAAGAGTTQTVAATLYANGDLVEDSTGEFAADLILAGHVGGLSVSISGIEVALDPFGTVPTSGLIADWRFEEGSGTTVADQTGTYDIDLTLPTSPNTSWTAQGVNADGGAIQTPIITDVRTIAFLARYERNHTGFSISGPTATTAGIYNSEVIPGSLVHMGNGFGLSKVTYDAATGRFCYRLVAAGWRLVIMEIPAADSGYLTFNSRGSSTLNRNAEFDIAWAAVWNTTLSDSDREAVYTTARRISVDRGFNLDFRDMAGDTADFMILAGQSNADGVAKISNLSASDQVRTYSQTYISQAGMSYSPTEDYAGLVLGSNHNNVSSAYFGPEIPIANSREDAGGNDLYILKAAQGSTFLAPISDPNSGPVTWSTDNPMSAAGFWSGLIEQMSQFIGQAVDAGVKLEMKGFVWFQGEQDADYTSTADVYETQLTQFFAEVDSFLGNSTYHIVVTRIYVGTPGIGYSTVRTAQENVVTSLGARATLVDVDSMSRLDDVHLDAAGLQSFGAAVVSTLWA